MQHTSERAGLAHLRTAVDSALARKSERRVYAAAARIGRPPPPEGSVPGSVSGRAGSGLKPAFLFAISFAFFFYSAGAQTNFLAGADFSHLKYFESLGAQYKDGGQTQDALQ